MRPHRDYSEAAWQHHRDWAHGGRWHGPPPEWRGPRWVTLWAPVILSFLVQVGFAAFTIRVGYFAPREAAWILGLAMVGPLALIAARRFPGPVVAVVAVASGLDLFVNDAGGPPYVALAFAIVSAVVRGARVWAWVSVGLVWVAAVGGAIMLGQNWPPGRIAGTTLGILIVFGIGEGMRSRRDSAAEYHRLRSQRELSEVQVERVRIARELHDVLAHSLSQINVQAGVGLHLMERQPDKAAEALASIKETSKSALDEVRAVLGVLRSEGASDAPLVPEPGLDRLPALVEGIRGVEVSLTNDIPSAPQNVQLALFRIAQESLTNITRHADATHATVRLWTEDGFYRLEVTDDGAGAGTTASETGGRGLLGMRERAELLGGKLTAGPADGGGFRVSASIPIGATPQ
jgi:signal transduction histidine kinase